MSAQSPRWQRSLTSIALTFLVIGTVLASSAAAQESRASRKVRTAHEVYRELIELPEKKVPKELLGKARCLAVIPSVIKGAFVWGGHRGRGVMTCRRQEGWSPLVFVKLSGGSFGFQAGGESTDLVLFFMTERGVRSLLKSKFILGGDASIAAGPLGRRASMGTDLRLNAEIFSYAKSRGVFAGISVEGGRLAPDNSWTDGYYEARLWPADVLLGNETPRTPDASRDFLAALP